MEVALHAGRANTLNPEAGRKLTLVSAPAGIGKTTLLGAWTDDRADSGHPVAWLSLDGGENYPSRFLSYLVASLRIGTGKEGFGEAVLTSLRSREPPSNEVSTASLVNMMLELIGRRLVWRRGWKAGWLWWPGGRAGPGAG